MVEILIAIENFEKFKAGEKVKREWDANWQNVVGIQLDIEFVTFPDNSTVQLTEHYRNRRR